MYIYSQGQRDIYSVYIYVYINILNNKFPVNRHTVKKIRMKKRES